MSAACLIFGLPMILAAVLISPTGLHDVIHGLPLAAIAVGVLLPFAAWPIFLSYFVLPPREVVESRPWLSCGRALR
jgi:uncharacterized BrkB/YihY/UPF0761 family membrane protein